MRRTGMPRAAVAVVAVVALATGSTAAGAERAPGRYADGVPRGAEPIGVQPVPAGPAFTVSVSPVLVPPAAPVDVTVRSRALAGRKVDVLLAAGSSPAAEWRFVASVVLDERGAGHVALVRTAPTTYRVRAVALLDGGVAAASEEGEFAVTATGLGDRHAYRYLVVSRGAPARWNPCAVVTYRVNGALAEGTSRADLQEALRRVSYETGVRFRYLGDTTYVPGTPRFRYEADLVVAWSRPGETTELGGSRAAAAGIETVPGRDGRPRIARGFVVVDADRELTAGFGKGATEGQVLLHELGHVMGLGHVASEYQVMQEEVQDAKAALYGAGDLTGLRRLGRKAGCL